MASGLLDWAGKPSTLPGQRFICRRVACVLAPLLSYLQAASCTACVPAEPAVSSTPCTSIMKASTQCSPHPRSMDRSPNPSVASSGVSVQPCSPARMLGTAAALSALLSTPSRCCRLREGGE